MTVLSVSDGTHWEVFQKERLITGGISGFYGAVERTGHWYGYFGGITLDQASISGESPDTLDHPEPVLYEVDLLSTKTRAVAKRSDDESVRRDWIVGADGTVSATFDFSVDRGEWDASQCRARSNRDRSQFQGPRGSRGSRSVNRWHPLSPTGRDDQCRPLFRDSTRRRHTGGVTARYCSPRAAARQALPWVHRLHHGRGLSTNTTLR